MKGIKYLMNNGQAMHMGSWWQEGACRTLGAQADYVGSQLHHDFFALAVWYTATIYLYSIVLIGGIHGVQGEC